MLLMSVTCSEIKDEKTADIERKKAINKERKEKEAEKLRLQQMAARVRVDSPQAMAVPLGVELTRANATSPV